MQIMQNIHNNCPSGMALPPCRLHIADCRMQIMQNMQNMQIMQNIHNNCPSGMALSPCSTFLILINVGVSFFATSDRSWKIWFWWYQMPILPSRLNEEVSHCEFEDPSCQGQSFRQGQTTLPSSLRSVTLSPLCLCLLRPSLFSVFFRLLLVYATHNACIAQIRSKRGNEN